MGAFGDGIRQLRRRGFADALEEEVRQKGKPLLGICLGLQLLARVGYEQGELPGLGWIAGRVVRLESPPEPAALRIPHIGWNDVSLTRTSELFAGLRMPASFYFAHSYALVPDDWAVVSGVCEYGQAVVASLEAGNLYATQFHPEKSHRAGLAVLKNFVRIATACGVPC